MVGNRVAPSRFRRRCAGPCRTAAACGRVRTRGTWFRRASGRRPGCGWGRARGIRTPCYLGQIASPAICGQDGPGSSVAPGRRTPWRRAWPAAISLIGGRYRLLFLRQRHGRGFDRVEPGAIVPQDLAPGLAAQWQAEELLDRLREGAVGVRIVRRHHEIFGADLVDDIYRRLLVDIERDVALALEVLARQHRQLTLAAGSEFLPLIVEPPQPPVEPPRRSFEERGPQFGMAFEDATGGKAGDRPNAMPRSCIGGPTSRATMTRARWAYDEGLRRRARPRRRNRH